jgi:flagellar hook-associated protein 2
MGLRIGGITFGGIASGLPTEEIIEKLLALERRPIDLLEGQKESFGKKLSILQDLASKTRTLRDRLRKLDGMNLLGTGLSGIEEFKRFAATSSDDTIAAATAAPSAQPGKLLLRVDALARAEREISPGFAALTTVLGTGNLRISVDGVDTDITIDGSNNTLEGVVAAINDSAADVTAFALNDGSATPYRIMVTGNQTGASQAVSFAIDAGLSLSFTTSQAASDAQITLDPDGASPITIVNSSNTFSEIMRGLTIETRKLDASTVVIDVAEDTDAMVTAISEVVAAYNDVVKLINEQAKVDPATNRGGPLIGDSALLGLQRRLSSLIASSFGSGQVRAASSIGISLGDNGALELDEAKLRAKLESDVDAVAEFFAGTGSFADSLRAATDAAVDPVDGSLVTRINGTSESIRDLEDRITTAEDRLDTVEENLVRQFAALERQISGIQLQSTYLAQFLLSSNR